MYSVHRHLHLLFPQLSWGIDTVSFKIRVIIINIFFFKDNQVWSFYFLFLFELIKNSHDSSSLSFNMVIIGADSQNRRRSYRPFPHPPSAAEVFSGAAPFPGSPDTQHSHLRASAVRNWGKSPGISATVQIPFPHPA